MNSKILGFVVCVKAIIYLLFYDLHDCTFDTKIDIRMYHIVEEY